MSREADTPRVTGWDQGCMGMRVGEERKLVIPADEGYGAGGFPAWGIPPGGTAAPPPQSSSFMLLPANSTATHRMARAGTLDFTLECLKIQK